MKFKFFEIDKKIIEEKINEEINKKNTIEFNKLLKKIMSLKSINDVILIQFAISNMLLYEETVSETTALKTKVISNMIKSENVKNGQEIYKYNFSVEDTNKTSNIFFEVNRKDGEKDEYEYILLGHLNLIKNIIEKNKFEEHLIEKYKMFIDLIYQFVEEYTEKVDSIDEELFVKEIIYIIGGPNSNEIYREFLNDNSSK